jgi:hypothetical protein
VIQGKGKDGEVAQFPQFREYRNVLEFGITITRNGVECNTA